MESIVFIVGPTAVGKTEVSVLLAKELHGEIISCDSMQIYKEPAVIVAKPPLSALKAIKHHFIGQISVSQTYNVFDYYTQARKKIIQLHTAGKTPLVCGGSGLYAKALCDGIFEGVARDEQIRRELMTRAEKEGLAVLYRELTAVDPQAAAKISMNDARRIIRALEVYHVTGIPISQKQKQANGLHSEFRLRLFGLRLKRQELYQRINIRTEKMFQEGAIDEVAELRKLPLSITAQRIIGLSEISGFLDGRYSRDEALAVMQKNTRNFAKRQMTWFRKDKRIEWIDVDGMPKAAVRDEILKKLRARTS